MHHSELQKNITKQTRVVIPVHFAGQSCDMRKIKDTVCEAEKHFKRKIIIIEDASHALGSLYFGKKVGCCEYSDAVIFSFHPVKHITTGEGGMVVTNDSKLAKKIKSFRSHDVTKNKNKNAFINSKHSFISQKQDAGCNVFSQMPWYYEQQSLGYNYRLTDIQSALGRSQLKKLDWFRARRKHILEKYNYAFGDLPYVTIPFEASRCNSNFHLYVVKIDFEALGLSRIELINDLKNKGVKTQVHYIPVYLQPFYRQNYGTTPGDCPNAEKYYSQCLSLPFFPGMTDQEIKQVIVAVEKALSRCGTRKKSKKTDSKST
jgi:dTDP-4-amino-4,6-dideoxygalactose transaminase